MAGPEGFEPPNARTKTWCLTTWRRPNIAMCASIETGISRKDEYIINRPAYLGVATYEGFVDVRGDDWQNKANERGDDEVQRSNLSNVQRLTEWSKEHQCL